MMRYFQSPRFFVITLAAGLAIVVSLLVKEGIREVAAALMMAGWNILWVVAFRFVPMAIDAAGWKYLIVCPSVPGFTNFVSYRWVAESCNTLLPAAQVGGHLARALMLARRLPSRAMAGASVVVDFTLGLGTQFLFIVVGLLLLMVEVPPIPNTALPAIVTGGLLVLGGFIFVQYRGISGIFNRIASRFMNNRQIMRVVGGLETLEKETVHLYSDYNRLMVCALIRFAGWTMKSGETYLALLFLGASPSITEAVVLEAVGIAANSFGFLVPGALGVREGGIFAVAAFLGVSAETALALALIKRCRELAVGLPGLAVLLIFEKDILFSAKNDFRKKPVNDKETD